MEVWKTSLSYWEGISSGAMLNFGRVLPCEAYYTFASLAIPKPHLAESVLARGSLVALLRSYIKCRHGIQSVAV